MDLKRLYLKNSNDKLLWIFLGNGGYDQSNQMSDYSQNYVPTPSQSGYNANGYSQYSQQSYSQPSEYDHSQGYSQDYK